MSQKSNQQPTESKKMKTNYLGLQKVAPALTLFVLSAIIVELLFGTTHLTIITALIPEIGFYGGAALVIRYAVRRLHRSWFSILLLGVAFAVFEEFLIVQTSVSPTLFVGMPEIYSRIFGVNWIYFLWAAGYEGVWGIVLPIYLTEIIFSTRREDPWLSKRGLVATVVVFALASLVSWGIWTQEVAPQALGYIYSPPLSLIIFALIVITGLIIVALVPRPPLHLAYRATRMRLKPWSLGALVFVLSLLWFVLVAFAFNTFPTIPVAIAIVPGLILAGAVLFLVLTQSKSSGWDDEKRLAIIIGGLFASMIAGFWASGIVLAIDFVGKIIFNIITVALLVYLAWSLHKHSQE